jgi:hypothetical protein
LVRDIILGILGAVVGDAIFTQLGYVGVTGVNLASIVIAAIGAILILVLYHAIMGKRATALSRPRPCSLASPVFVDYILIADFSDSIALAPVCARLRDD